MLMFIKENLATLVVGAAVLALLCAALWSIYRSKRRAAREGGCGGGCCGCPHSKDCHGK